MEDVRRRAAEDAGTVGVLLIGSRAAGTAREGSDYDLIWVVTERTGDMHVKEGEFDIHYLTIGRLREKVDDHDWTTGALLTSQLVWDPTGELARVLDEMRARAGERARADVPSAYDAYLNSYVRSLKAWRRGNELGGRMHAVESLTALARTLFGVAGRWPVYHDELEASLPEVEQELGISVLADLRAIAATGDAATQRELEARVERFMSGRGIAHQWGDALREL